jgi:acyl carrier protein
MKEKIIKIISQVMGVPIEMISGDSSPDTIEEWDSLKHMNLVLALEEEFGIQFTDEQIVEMLSVELIVEVMNEIIK